MPCIKCKAETVTTGACDACRPLLLNEIRPKLLEIGTYATAWMTTAEQWHLERIFYSDEAAAAADTDLRDNAQNGYAPKMSAKGKVFTLMNGGRSSVAVKAFIGGGKTVCECEGLMHAVYLNAICQACGDEVFDLMFPTLTIGDSKSSPINKFFSNNKEDKEDNIQPGDWVYILVEEKSKFQEAVKFTGKGAAGGGWNLICTEKGKYMGFGLNEKGQSVAKTLADIREQMAAECTGIKDAPKPLLSSSLPGATNSNSARFLAALSQPKSTSSATGEISMLKQRRGSGSFAPTMTSKPVAVSSESTIIASELPELKKIIKDSIKVQWFNRIDGNKVITAVEAAVTPSK